MPQKSRYTLVIDGLSRWVPCPLPAAFLPPLLTCWASYHLAVPVSPQACDYTGQEALSTAAAAAAGGAAARCHLLPGGAAAASLCLTLSASSLPLPPAATRAAATSSTSASGEFCAAVCW